MINTMGTPNSRWELTPNGRFKDQWGNVASSSRVGLGETQLNGQVQQAPGWNANSFGGGNGSGQWSSSFNSPADRYDEILKGYKDRYDRNVGALDSLGAIQQQNIATGYANQAASQQQDITGRGLAGSSVLDTMKAGNATAKMNAQAQAAAALQAQKGQLDAQLSGDTLAFQERYKPVAAASQGSGQHAGAGGAGGNWDASAFDIAAPWKGGTPFQMSSAGTGNWSDTATAGASRRPEAARKDKLAPQNFAKGFW